MITSKRTSCSARAQCTSCALLPQLSVSPVILTFLSSKSTKWDVHSLPSNVDGEFLLPVRGQVRPFLLLPLPLPLPRPLPLSSLGVVRAGIDHEYPDLAAIASARASGGADGGCGGGIVFFIVGSPRR